MTVELSDIYKIFKSRKDCVSFLEMVRWNNVPQCPKCGSKKFSSIKEKEGYHCNFCNRTFTVTTNTIFHKSQLDLQKWFYVIYQTINPETYLTSRQLGIELNITKDTAWSMQKKIKNGLISSPEILLTIEKYLTKKLDEL